MDRVVRCDDGFLGRSRRQDNVDPQEQGSGVRFRDHHGVETETFWGKIDEERSAYFVGISRAKNRLLLTVCDHRDRPQGASRWTSQRTAHAEFLGYASAYA